MIADEDHGIALTSMSHPDPRADLPFFKRIAYSVRFWFWSRFVWPRRLAKATETVEIELDANGMWRIKE